MRKSSHVDNPNATRLPGGISWSRALLRRSSALARASLGLTLASMLAGCLVEDPPPYAQPRKTVPWLDLRAAVPPYDRIIERNENQSIAFNVPVVSEDAGDPLVGFLMLDYTGGAVTQPVGTNTVRAGTFDEKDRRLDIPYVVKAAPGCHHFTLLVTHQSNYSYADNGRVLDPADLTVALWWANIRPQEGSGEESTPCPGNQRQ